MKLIRIGLKLFGIACRSQQNISDADKINVRTRTSGTAPTASRHYNTHHEPTTSNRSARPVSETITMATSQLRAIGAFARNVRVSQRAFTTTARQLESAVKATEVEQTGSVEITQAPNRVGIWSRSQRPRSTAMTGPRFEQTDFSVQVLRNSSLGEDEG